MSDIIAQNPVKRDRHISDKLNPADFSSGKITHSVRTSLIFVTSPLLSNFSLFFSMSIYGIWVKLIW